jgi:hypothetical protein
MLNIEHLDRACEVELAIGEWQLPSRHHPVLEVRGLMLRPAGLDRVLLEVDAHEPPVA